MNVPVRNVTASQTLAIVDCDIHPALRRLSDLHRSCRRAGASS